MLASSVKTKHAADEPKFHRKPIFTVRWMVRANSYGVTQLPETTGAATREPAPPENRSENASLLQRFVYLVGGAFAAAAAAVRMIFA